MKKIVALTLACLMAASHASPAMRETDGALAKNGLETALTDSLPQAAPTSRDDAKTAKQERKLKKSKKNQYDYRVLTPDSLFRIDAGRVDIYFRLYTGDKKTRAQHQRKLVPVLISKDSLHQKELPPVYAYGRTRYLKNLREHRIPETADTLLIGKNTKGAEIDLNTEVRFEGWGAGVGIAYGYQWLLSKNWSIEASIGIGYIYSIYDKFPCATCGTLIGEGVKHYFGPTKASLSVIYIMK